MKIQDVKIIKAYKNQQEKAVFNITTKKEEIMKKKLFRERYAKNVASVETFDTHIKNPELKVKTVEKKKKASKKKEA